MKHDRKKEQMALSCKELFLNGTWDLPSLLQFGFQKQPVCDLPEEAACEPSFQLAWKKEMKQKGFTFRFFLHASLQKPPVIQVWDEEFQEEYIGWKLQQGGEFKEAIRQEAEALIKEISARCFFKRLFPDPAASHIAAKISQEQGSRAGIFIAGFGGLCGFP